MFPTPTHLHSRFYLLLQPANNSHHMSCQFRALLKSSNRNQECCLSLTTTWCFSSLWSVLQCGLELGDVVYFWISQEKHWMQEHMILGVYLQGRHHTSNTICIYSHRCFITLHQSLIESVLWTVGSSWSGVTMFLVIQLTNLFPKHPQGPEATYSCTTSAWKSNLGSYKYP